MEFGCTLFYVENVEATLSFYGRASTGASILAFAAMAFVGSHFSVPIQRGGARNDAAPFEIALLAGDVQAAFDRAVAAGATRVQDPAGKPWGQTVSYVRDNNGFMVGICSPVTPAEN